MKRWFDECEFVKAFECVEQLLARFPNDANGLQWKRRLMELMLVENEVAATTLSDEVNERGNKQSNPTTLLLLLLALHLLFVRLFIC